MDPKTKAERERTNRLAYLALYYSIQGNEEKANQVRKMIEEMGEKKEGGK